MKTDTIKMTLGLQETGMHTGESVVHMCEIMEWPADPQQKVYVMDCDFQGKPLREGYLRVFTSWNIGLKVHKEIDCAEEFLLENEGRSYVLNELLL